MTNTYENVNATDVKFVYGNDRKLYINICISIYVKIFAGMPRNIGLQ